MKTYKDQKGQSNTDLIIGIIFALVVGGAFFGLATKNDLPKADEDPTIKVEDGSLGDEDDIDIRKDIFDESNPMLAAMKETKNEKYTAPPPQVINADKDYEATITTNKGNIKMYLFDDTTPITVNNFVFLARNDFYQETRSHRIIKGFMVQFGDPLSSEESLKSMWGTGSPGYSFPDESFSGDYLRGTVAMANSGPDTNGSQFFIVHQKTALPKSYVIFGQVKDEESLRVLDAIANVQVEANRAGEISLPVEDIIINKVAIMELEDGTVPGSQEEYLELQNPKEDDEEDEDKEEDNKDDEENTDESDTDKDTEDTEKDSDNKE